MLKLKKTTVVKILILAVVVFLVIAFTLYRTGLSPERDTGLDVPSITEENSVHFSEAPDKVGEDLWVRGEIDHVYISDSDNYFLNFCPDHRECPFSAPIFAEDTDEFEDIESWSGSEIYIYGTIKTYEGRPQIIIEDPKQIRLGEKNKDPFNDREDGKVEVISVIDGDTIKVSLKGVARPVRLIGIDAPEVKSPYSEEECYGLEATEYLEHLLSDSEVLLEWDEDLPKKDKYGRMLNYVYLPEGEFVNAKMIEEGYAFFYKKESFDKEEMFLRLESKAIKERKGLWGDQCQYYDQRPAEDF